MRNGICAAPPLRLLFSAVLCFLLGVCAARAEDCRTLKLVPARGMTRAELKYYAPPAECAGALVLCPGWNGDGAGWIRDKSWREFAAKQKLLLVGISFASPDEEETEKAAYHYSENGSAKILFDGLEKIFAKHRVKRLWEGESVPVVLFGFSRGGQFALSVAAHFPERVRAWGCTGSGGMEIPLPGVKKEPPPAAARVAGTGVTLARAVFPPGVIVCGLEDTNQTHSLEMFFRLLRARARVCWLGVPRSGHVVERRAEAWVREFFGAVLLGISPAEEITVEDEFSRGLDGFLLDYWFPSRPLFESWKKFE